MGPKWLQEMRRDLFCGSPSQEHQWNQIHRLQFLTAQSVLEKSRLEEKSSPLPYFLRGLVECWKKYVTKK